MRKVFKITNNYIVLATVLILYSLISNVYAAFFTVGGVKIIGLIFAFILLILMTTAFLAGWFKMVKKAVLEEKFNDPNSLIKDFPEGVGEYFLPILGMMLKFAIVFALIGAGVFYLGYHHIGNPNVDWQTFAKVSSDMAGMKTFLLGLQPEQITKLAQWNQLMLGGLMFGYFVLFLYPPALIFKNKNPFIAFFIAIKDLLSKKFFKTLGVFLLILILNSIISVISVITASNVVLGLISTLAGFYILTASAVGLFYYYYQNFMTSHLGQNVDVKI